ncbi:nucleosome assembly protein, putative [Babesia bigemina]|uniref:Nucleosome assembly protein, putative n=1 Tax=Babesia bigemina TaxID=5866 RepID=A0A061D403_BABBI|nr:nucleosome assembly protein, putative [Babesia bigemina]CDR94782.1 nucleosome assembly protein, putative [Babesia bigemina]|eukprot:XP_012766968.1 nucleosome assembly protein, putative [Babesia bigemina]
MKRTLDEGNSAANINQMSQSQKPETQAVLPYIHEFDEVQKQLLDIDEECANRQIEIQREYDRKKQPHFKRRQACVIYDLFNGVQEIINKIPGFWARAILHHPALSYLTTADMPVLELLEKVELDDNIDNNGSYKVTLTFGEGAREYMEPLVLTKHVRFSDNKEDVVECTEIHWRPGMNPIDVAIKARSDERCIDWSLFEWFTKDEWINRPDFGEILRRELWHAPLAYYLDTVSVDFVDDEYDMLEEDDD